MVNLSTRLLEGGWPRICRIRPLSLHGSLYLWITIPIYVYKYVCLPACWNAEGPVSAEPPAGSHPLQTKYLNRYLYIHIFIAVVNLSTRLLKCWGPRIGAAPHLLILRLCGAVTALLLLLGRRCRRCIYLSIHLSLCIYNIYLLACWNAEGPVSAEPPAGSSYALSCPVSLHISLCIYRSQFSYISPCIHIHIPTPTCWIDIHVFLSG